MKNSLSIKTNVPQLKRQCGDLWFEASQMAWRARAVERNNAEKLKHAYGIMHEVINLEKEFDIDERK